MRQADTRLRRRTEPAAGPKTGRASFREDAQLPDPEKPYPLVALGIAIASFMGLLLVYGLNTWLPQLMAAAGYTVSTGLVLLLVLNVGAVAGLVVAGILADKHGTKKIVLLWFGLSAVFLAILSVKIQNELLLNAAVFVTGVFVFSSQVLVYAWVSQLFPPRLRGTALGFAAGVGRLGAIMGPAVTGTLVAAGIAYPWGFYVFARRGVLAGPGPGDRAPRDHPCPGPGSRRRALLNRRRRAPGKPVLPRAAQAGTGRSSLEGLPAQPPPHRRRQHHGNPDGGTDHCLHDPVPEQDVRARPGTTSSVEIRASGVTKTCAST